MTINSKSRGFQEISHTADLAIRVWATNLPDLFQCTAQGMYSLMHIQFKSEEVIYQDMKLEELDYESLLISFLSFLLSELEDHKIVYEVFQLQINDKKLRGHLIGKKIKTILREIKAVTYNNLIIKKTADLYSTEIVFDV